MCTDEGFGSGGKSVIGGLGVLPRDERKKDDFPDSGEDQEVQGEDREREQKEVNNCMVVDSDVRSRGNGLYCDIEERGTSVSRMDEIMVFRQKCIQRGIGIKNEWRVGIVVK